MKGHSGRSDLMESQESNASLQPRQYLSPIPSTPDSQIPEYSLHDGRVSFSRGNLFSNNNNNNAVEGLDLVDNATNNVSVTPFMPLNEGESPNHEPQVDIIPNEAAGYTGGGHDNKVVYLVCEGAVMEKTDKGHYVDEGYVDDTVTVLVDPNGIEAHNLRDVTNLEEETPRMSFNYQRFLAATEPGGNIGIIYEESSDDERNSFISLDFSSNDNTTNSNTKETSLDQFGSTDATALFLAELTNDGSDSTSCKPSLFPTKPNLEKQTSSNVDEKFTKTRTPFEESQGIGTETNLKDTGASTPGKSAPGQRGQTCSSNHVILSVVVTGGTTKEDEKAESNKLESGSYKFRSSTPEVDSNFLGITPVTEKDKIKNQSTVSSSDNGNGENIVDFKDINKVNKLRSFENFEIEVLPDQGENKRDGSHAKISFSIRTFLQKFSKKDSRNNKINSKSIPSRNVTTLKNQRAEKACGKKSGTPQLGSIEKVDEVSGRTSKAKNIGSSIFHGHRKRNSNALQDSKPPKMFSKQSLKMFADKSSFFPHFKLKPKVKKNQIIRKQESISYSPEPSRISVSPTSSSPARDNYQPPDLEEIAAAETTPPLSPVETEMLPHHSSSIELAAWPKLVPGSSSPTARSRSTLVLSDSKSGINFSPKQTESESPSSSFPSSPVKSSNLVMSISYAPSKVRQASLSTSTSSSSTSRSVDSPINKNVTNVSVGITSADASTSDFKSVESNNVGAISSSNRQSNKDKQATPGQNLTEKESTSTIASETLKPNSYEKSFVLATRTWKDRSDNIPEIHIILKENLSPIHSAKEKLLTKFNENDGSDGDLEKTSKLSTSPSKSNITSSNFEDKRKPVLENSSPLVKDKKNSFQSNGGLVVAVSVSTNTEPVMLSPKPGEEAQFNPADKALPNFTIKPATSSFVGSLFKKVQLSSLPEPEIQINRIPIGSLKHPLGQDKYAISNIAVATLENQEGLNKGGENQGFIPDRGKLFEELKFSITKLRESNDNKDTESKSDQAENPSLESKLLLINTPGVLANKQNSSTISVTSVKVETKTVDKGLGTTPFQSSTVYQPAGSLQTNPIIGLDSILEKRDNLRKTIILENSSKMFCYSNGNRQDSAGKEKIFLEKINTTLENIKNERSIDGDSSAVSSKSAKGSNAMMANKESNTGIEDLHRYSPTLPPTNLLIRKFNSPFESSHCEKINEAIIKMAKTKSEQMEDAKSKAPKSELNIQTQIEKECIEIVKGGRENDGVQGSVGVNDKHPLEGIKKTIAKVYDNDDKERMRDITFGQKNSLNSSSTSYDSSSNNNNNNNNNNAYQYLLKYTSVNQGKSVPIWTSDKIVEESISPSYNSRHFGPEQGQAAEERTAPPPSSTWTPSTDRSHPDASVISGLQERKKKPKPGIFLVRDSFGELSYSDNKRKSVGNSDGAKSKPSAEAGLFNRRSYLPDGKYYSGYSQQGNYQGHKKDLDKWDSGGSLITTDLFLSPLELPTELENPDN